MTIPPIIIQPRHVARYAIETGNGHVSVHFKSFANPYEALRLSVAGQAAVVAAVGDYYAGLDETKSGKLVNAHDEPDRPLMLARCFVQVTPSHVIAQAALGDEHTLADILRATIDTDGMTEVAAP